MMWQRCIRESKMLGHEYLFLKVTMQKGIGRAQLMNMLMLNDREGEQKANNGKFDH